MGKDEERLSCVARDGDLMPSARQDALKGAPVELLVVDDENVGLSQGWFLRAAEGGSRIVGGGPGRFKQRRLEGPRVALDRPASSRLGGPLSVPK